MSIPARDHRIQVCPRLKADDYERLRRIAFERGLTPATLGAQIIEEWMIERAPVGDGEMPK